MFNFILSILTEYYPQIGVSIAVIVFVGFLVHKFTIFYTETNKSVNKLPAIEDSLKRIEQSFLILNQLLLEENKK